MVCTESYVRTSGQKLQIRKFIVWKKGSSGEESEPESSRTKLSLRQHVSVILKNDYGINYWIANAPSTQAILRSMSHQSRCRTNESNCGTRTYIWGDIRWSGDGWEAAEIKSPGLDKIRSKHPKTEGVPLYKAVANVLQRRSCREKRTPASWKRWKWN